MIEESGMIWRGDNCDINGLELHHRWGSRCAEINNQTCLHTEIIPELFFENLNAYKNLSLNNYQTVKLRNPYNFFSSDKPAVNI